MLDQVVQCIDVFFGPVFGHISDGRIGYHHPGHYGCVQYPAHDNGDACHRSQKVNRQGIHLIQKNLDTGTGPGFGK